VCVPRKGERATIERFHDGVVSPGPRAGDSVTNGGWLVFPLGDKASAGGGDDSRGHQVGPADPLYISRVSVRV